MIGSAIQNGSFVNVFNEKGIMLFSLGGVLQGFSGSTVTIKHGDVITIYNERGNAISSQSVFR